MYFKVGDKVKASYYRLEQLRSQSQGGFSQRMRDVAKREYERVGALRGEVIEVSELPKPSQGQSVTVKWSDGTRSLSLDYMIEKAGE